MVARVLLQLVNDDPHPLRLLLGSDAYRYATQAGRDLLASDERMESVSRSTDADRVNSGHDPLAALAADS